MVTNGISLPGKGIRQSTKKLALVDTSREKYPGNIMYKPHTRLQENGYDDMWYTK